MADESPSMDSLIGTRARDESGRFVSVTPTEEPKPKTEPVTAEPAKAAVDATPVDITPKDVAPKPVEPVVVPPPVQTETEKEQAYKKAMQAEREKRQAAEARLRELEAPKKEPVDPWTDLPGALKSEREQIQETLFVERCNLTADLARMKHTDYDEMQAAFLEAAEADPSLFARLRQERNPAEFAYKHGVLHRELGSVNGDMTAYREKLRASIRAEVEAEFAAKGGKPAPVVPASINSDTSPVAATEVYAGPPPINTILRNAKASRS